MKAIKIDVVKKDVYEVNITDDIQTMYKHLECSCFCTAGTRDNGDTLFVDDEGLLHEPIGTFEWAGRILSGHGLLVGVDFNTGDTRNVKSSIDFVKQHVRFTDRPLPKPGFTFISLGR